MKNCFYKLKYDPIGPLLRCESASVRMFAMNDLLGETTFTADSLTHPMVSRILANQLRGKAFTVTVGKEIKRKMRFAINRARLGASFARDRSRKRRYCSSDIKSVKKVHRQSNPNDCLDYF